ncbi:MAG: hypothetical protein ACOCYY_04890 [Desulfohalobiaceae bacterium]
MENFNPQRNRRPPLALCIGQNIDYDYDKDNDCEGRAEQIGIVVFVVVAVDTDDINLTTGRRAIGLPALLAQRRCWRGGRPF